MLSCHTAADIGHVSETMKIIIILPIRVPLNR